MVNTSIYGGETVVHDRWQKDHSFLRPSLLIYPTEWYRPLVFSYLHFCSKRRLGDIRTSQLNRMHSSLLLLHMHLRNLERPTKIWNLMHKGKRLQSRIL